MEIQHAKTTDAESIARVARESLTASYSHFIDEDTIDDMVEQWYAEDEIDARIGDDTSTFVVVTEGDDVLAFAQGAIIEGEPVVGELDWLHVTPDERGEGIGVQLLGHVQERLEDQGVDVLRGLVLAENEEGAGFYEDHGFERADEREVEIEGERFVEVVYEKEIGERPDEQVVETVEGPEGEEMFVSFSEAERGNKAPFYAVYRDRDMERHYAWFCGNCETLATAMDSAGRIICEECENTRAATRWDSSYL